MEIDKRLFILLIVVIIGASAFGVSYNFTHPTLKPQTNTASATAITLVITTNNNYNSTVGAQPAYYLLVNGSLVSASTIQIPAFQKVTFTIINYDNGSAYPLGEPGTNVSNGAGPASFYTVSGTVGNVEKVINDTDVNSTQTSSGIR